jgi:cytochrome c553
MPRLAGQTSAYSEKQLAAFAERTRDPKTVVKLSKVHALNPAMRVALAQHFSDLEVRPSGGGPAGLVDTGRRIFEEGIPDANIPACAVCHGPDAMGDGVNPRLAGQLYSYVVKALANWSRERGQTPKADETSAAMAPIAQSLSRPQIEAVAAYLSRLQ